MDYLIASTLKISEDKLKESFSIFEKLINIKTSHSISITEQDKAYLLYLLKSVKDNCNYGDLYREKLYIYLTLIIVNFHCEYCVLYTDSKFNKKLFRVINNTNIMTRLFNLL